MADETLEIILRAQDQMSGTLNKVNAELERIGTTAQTTRTRTSLLQGAIGGLAAGASMAAFGALPNAVSSVDDILRSAVQSAMDEQAGMARLTIAVRDAIPAWNGSTAAIEAAIHARIGLGFSDDTLRSSFTGLVARTKDVNEALRLQAVAMDIARFRGVDLESASIAVGKAYQGSAVALQRMGLAVQAGSSGQAALSQAIAATRGQADAYAQTAAGRMEAAQGRVNESMQRFGTVVLPIVADAADNVTRAVGILTGAMDSYAPSVDKAKDKTFDLGNIIGNLWKVVSFSPIPGLLSVLDDLVNGSTNAAAAAAELAAEQDADRIAAAGMTDGTEQQARTLAAATTALTTHNAQLGAAAAEYARTQGGSETYTVYLNGMKVSIDKATAAQWALNDAASKYPYKAVDDFTVNAATGFRVTTAQAAASADAWQQYLASLDKTSAVTTRASDAVSSAVDREVAALKRLDEAQQTTFERMVANISAVLDRQLASLDAADRQRAADRQAAQDKRDLAAAAKALGEAPAAAGQDPTDHSKQDAVLAATRRVADLRAAIAERALTAQEDAQRKSIESAQKYIDSIVALETNATNRKALAATLQKREAVLQGRRDAAAASGDTFGAGLLDQELAAVRAAETRNNQAMRIGQATAAIQNYTTVHTTINLDGRTIAAVVDKYLGHTGRVN